MLVISCSSAKKLYRTTSTERQKGTKNTSAFDNARKSNTSSYQESNNLFTLEGKTIYLQERSKRIQTQLKKQNKTYVSLIDSNLEVDKQTTVVNPKIISGGARRASFHRRQQQRKPSTAIVYQKKTKSKHSSAPVERQPLMMCTTSLPSTRIPRRCCSFEETSQIFSTPEEARATLKRLLASRRHEAIMSETVNIDDSGQEQEDRKGLISKPEYLEETYNYLFQRHVQTLKGVIKEQEQQEQNEAYEIYQNKCRKQVIQLHCVREDDNTYTESDSAKSTRRTSCNISYQSGGEVINSDPCDSDLSLLKNDVDKDYSEQYSVQGCIKERSLTKRVEDALKEQPVKVNGTSQYVHQYRKTHQKDDDDKLDSSTRKMATPPEDNKAPQ